MATKKEYNGWYNYETWLVNLWTDDSFTDMAHDAYENAQAERSFTRAERAALDLADQIKDYVEEMNPNYESGMFADLLNAALSPVNWHEFETEDAELEDA